MLNNCRCENKKFAKLINTEECDIETDDINTKIIFKIEDLKPKVFKNKTLIKKI